MSIMNKKNRKDAVLDFLAECGQLKRVSRSGWWTVGIKDCESVADHSFRCAVIAYCIGQMEECNAEKAALIGLFNDVHEARINDFHKVASQYVPLREAEKKAFSDQVASLPERISSPIKKMMQELWDDKSPESIVARDADILECMIQGKEYYEQGFVQAKVFFERSESLLKTKSAKDLAKRLKDWDPRAWCQRLAVVER